MPDIFTGRITRRSLADAGLDGPAIRRLKHDVRSEVWSVDTADHGVVVVKRFAFSPWRQRVGLPLGVHPAQLELRQHRRLAAAGVPVVPIIDAGFLTHPTHVWLATPWAGDSLQQRITAALQQPDPAAALEPDLAAAAALTRTLIDAGYAFKDLKPSNLVLDDQGLAHLIDAGSARRTTSPARIDRMLSVMQRVLNRDHCPQPLIARYLAAVRQPPS